MDAAFIAIADQMTLPRGTIARRVGRDDEELTVTTLEVFDPDSIDMSCLLIIGSSQTRLGFGGTVWTRRSHTS